MAARKKTNDEAADVTKIVEPVWERPFDDDLRAVVADSLLEAGSPWGELIALQLQIAAAKATPAAKKLALTLAKRHRDIIGGPIAKLASTTKRWICDKGFLVECALDRRLVKRPDFEAALKAPHWATVRRVSVSILTIPQWWLAQWMKNPATKNVRYVDISNLVLERESPDKPWRVTKATDGTFYGKYLAAFASGLSAEEQKRLEYGPNVRSAIRARLEQALTKAGVKRASE